MKLFYVPMTRAVRARWMLEELEVPYELVRLDVSQKQNRQPEYLALNPTGHVPTLVDDDGRPIYETLAIILWLADRFPDKGLAPPIASPERGAYLQWMVFSIASLERYADLYSHHTTRLPEADRVPGVAAAARKAFLDHARVVDAHLDDKEYLVGGRFSAADLAMAAVLGWARMMGLLAELPRLEDYVRRCASRPAAKRSRAD